MTVNFIPKIFVNVYSRNTNCKISIPGRNNTAAAGENVRFPYGRPNRDTPAPTCLRKRKYLKKYTPQLLFVRYVLYSRTEIEILKCIFFPREYSVIVGEKLFFFFIFFFPEKYIFYGNFPSFRSPR